MKMISEMTKKTGKTFNQHMAELEDRYQFSTEQLDGLARVPATERDRTAATLAEFNRLRKASAAREPMTLRIPIFVLNRIYGRSYEKSLIRQNVKIDAARLTPAARRIAELLASGKRGLQYEERETNGEKFERRTRAQYGNNPERAQAVLDAYSPVPRAGEQAKNQMLFPLASCVNEEGRPVSYCERGHISPDFDPYIYLAQMAALVEETGDPNSVVGWAP